MNYDALKEELAKEEYKDLSDQAAADALNAQTIAVDVETIGGAQLLDATTTANYASLTAAQKDLFHALLGIPDMIVKGVNTRAHLATMFGAGTQTRTNLSALQTTTTSRRIQLGLPNVGAHHVATARGGDY